MLNPAFLWLMIAASSGGIAAPAGQPGDAMSQNQRARSGDIAIMEELEAARRLGTREAYDLFIARHPQHPLAEIARCERARLGSARN